MWTLHPTIIMQEITHQINLYFLVRLNIAQNLYSLLGKSLSHYWDSLQKNQGVLSSDYKLKKVHCFPWSRHHFL